MSLRQQKHRHGSLVLAVGLLVGAFAGVRPAAAQNLITPPVLIEDPSGTLTVADVARRTGTEISPAFSMGSTSWAHWIRVRVHAQPGGGRIVLFIRPSYLNEVRLFEPDASSPVGWKTRVTGNHFPFAGRDRASTSLGFVVNQSVPESTYYLRIKTRSSFSLQIQALTPEEADRKDHQRDLLEVFFVTSMVMLLIWAIQSYLLDRQKVMAWFALHQATYTLFGIAATGYLAPLATTRFPQLVDWANAILYLAIDLTCILFCRELFRPYGPPALLMRLLNLLRWCFPLLLIALFAGANSLAINGNAVLIKFSLLVFLVTAFSLRVERVPRRYVLQIFFIIIILFNALFWYAGRFTGLGRNLNLSAIQALVFDGLVFAALFGWVLHANARQVLRDGHESAMQLLLVQKKFEMEKELKKQMEIQARTDYLTGLCNRRRFIELAEMELTRSIRYDRPITLLVMDLDHFKRVNDTWGHAAGDVVLLRISCLIRECLRSSDIFARTGGEEFGALLPETSQQEAFQVAERVRSLVAETLIQMPTSEPLHVNVSIGLAAVNGRSVSLQTLTDEADRAMYRAKQAGRNCICVNDTGSESNHSVMRLTSANGASNA